MRYLLALFLAAAVLRAGAQTPRRSPTPTAEPDSVTIRIAGTDLRAAVQIMQQYLDRPVIFTGPSSGPPVSFETPRPVSRADVPRLLRGLLEAQNYELVADSASGTYRARPREPARPGLASAASLPSPPGMSARQTVAALELFVLPLHHARAVDVAATVNTLFGRAAPSVASSGGFGPRTLADELRSTQNLPSDPPIAQNVAGAAGRSATLSGELTVVPDARANSLLIRSNRADFELIQAAVQQIDVRPAQVLIEVLIVEARRDRSFSLGIAASVKDQHLPRTENTTLGGGFSPSGAGLGDFTLRVMGASGIDIDATITAAMGRGDVRVVSRPVVLTANDEQAEVVVGSQRPFVQVSRALPTSDAVRDQIIQYKDVGTKLTVRPTISLDGTVQLQVSQEVSLATSETQFNAPVISTRSIKTDLLVKDEQTIVLGGLTDRQRDVQSQGIPLLSSIPLLGGLFGRQSRNTSETELFVFLTPRVIRTDEDARRLTDPFHKRATGIKP